MEAIVADSKVIPNASQTASTEPHLPIKPQCDSKAIVLDGASLDCNTLLLAGADRATVEISSDSLKNVIIGRALVEKIAKGDAPAYGITTGVGSQKDFAIALGGMADYNRRLARAHSINAGGASLPEHRVRSALVVLVNQFASGLSGVSAPLVNLILDQINHSEMPEISSHGTVSASDLIPMAQIAVWLQSLPEAEAHQIPGPKETLSLINNNAITLAAGADVLIDARAVLKLANLSLALSLEASRANLKSISQDLRDLLKDSELWNDGVARRIQDPLSFRCGSQVHGALEEMLDRAETVWNDELNTVTDNPIIDTNFECARSHGNMDTTLMTLAIDGVRQAFAKAADLAGERIHKQQWKEFSGLPTGFSDHNSPLGGVQFLNLGHLASSFITSTKIWAAPSLLLSVGQVADGVEDTASYAFHAVCDLERILDATRLALTIEIIISVWAIKRRDLSVDTLGIGVRACVDIVLPMLSIGSEGYQVFSIEPVVCALRRHLTDTNAS